ncbi:uncharacterized protein BYT42DRAFT_560322 [Radiomyces spectabilis]|uniref:uncharacterized protein n=1 Tax=Radiomyces spectabilis TaxID=64574 RepID=UPI00221E94B9|nr:uncharacterized protein BYT42DRAFT_560322 [Radiomyces spectabilis]KAI8388516.1 hypothetical protein BYT42DRAFT_560322 [Radiomyces spectabilis]
MAVSFDKSASASSSSSFRFDKTLSATARFGPIERSDGGGFRHSNAHSDPEPDPDPEQLECHTHSIKNRVAMFQPMTDASRLDLDGIEVQSFLENGDYYDEIYGDDLNPCSSTYATWSHQLDHRHSLAENHKLGHLVADDTVEYLHFASYIDDIYGLPSPLSSPMKEARQEEDENVPRQFAVERLTMVRKHLLERAHTGPEKEDYKSDRELLQREKYPQFI